MALIYVLKQKMTNQYDSAPVLDQISLFLIGQLTQIPNHYYIFIKIHFNFFSNNDHIFKLSNVYGLTTAGWPCTASAAIQVPAVTARLKALCSTMQRLSFQPANEKQPFNSIIVRMSQKDN